MTFGRGAEGIEVALASATVYSGTIDVNDNYAQLANGNLVWEIGNQAPTGFAVEVGGTASLAGTFEIALDSGFAPTLNDEFQVLAAAGGISGQFTDVIEAPLPAGLAWELTYQPTTVLLTVVPELAGDYNRNGSVDAADYTVWRNTLGASVAAYDGADGSGNMLVDADDFDVWRMHFGKMAGSGSSAAAESADLAVPEPATVPMFFVGIVAWLSRQRVATSQARVFCRTYR